MVKALCIKELRESAVVLTLGLLAMAWLLCQVTGSELLGTRTIRAYIPFVGDSFVRTLVLYGGVMAVALGFKQSAWEQWLGTYPYLLHRPMPRRRIFEIKLVIGIVSVMVVTALPILLFAVWAARPGSSPSPFEWSMTGDAWRAWWTIPLLYLSAFLCGIRPGKWLGTKLFPLAGSLMLVPLTQSLMGFPWGWPYAVVLLALGYVTTACAIGYVVEHRDY